MAESGKRKGGYYVEDEWCVAYARRREYK